MCLVVVVYLLVAPTQFNRDELRANSIAAKKNNRRIHRDILNSFNIGMHQNRVTPVLHETLTQRYKVFSQLYIAQCNLYVIFRWSPQMAHSMVNVYFHSGTHYDRFNCSKNVWVYVVCRRLSEFMWFLLQSKSLLAAIRPFLSLTASHSIFPFAMAFAFLLHTCWCMLAVFIAI